MSIFFILCNGKTGTDNTTSCFSILSLSVCNAIAYNEIENINSSKQEVYFNVYKVVCYIHAHFEKKGVYKICLKNKMENCCILAENSELHRTPDSWNFH